MPRNEIELDKGLDAPYRSIRPIAVDVTPEDSQRIDSVLKEAAKVLNLGRSQTSFSHDDFVYQSYILSPYEKRVDFAAIEKALDGDAVKTDLALRVPIRKVLDDLIGLIRNQDKAGGITQGFVQSLSLTTGPEAQKILGEYLLGIWRKGRELAAGELPEKIKQKIAPIRTFHLQGLHDQQDHDPTGGGGINFGDGKTPLTEEKIKTILPTIKKGKFID